MNAVQHDLDLQSMALLEIGRALQRDSYAFVTITPQTHRRINERAQAVGCGQARTLRDVFGWCRPFSPSLLPRRMLELLMTAGQVEQVERPEGVDGEGPWLRSKVRFSTAEDQLFVHSAHPTTEQDAVFFGPDTYRFRSLIRQRAPRYARYVVDVCGGSGAGAMVLARRAERLAVADVNRMALRLAAINATLAGVTIDVLESDVLDAVEEPPDLIVANPPYMKDARHRAYRDGGGEHGEALSLRIVRDAVHKLAPCGELILYTGTAVVDGVDTFHAKLAPLLEQLGDCVGDFSYEQLDPDVFGEELDSAGYADVDRISVVGLHVRKRS